MIPGKTNFSDAEQILRILCCVKCNKNFKESGKEEAHVENWKRRKKTDKNIFLQKAITRDALTTPGI